MAVHVAFIYFTFSDLIFHFLLSLFVVQDVTTNLRIATENRNLFEPHLREILRQKNKSLDELFSVELIDGNPVVKFLVT